MPFDPFRHRQRSIRLQGYDYTQAGAYFVTINTHNRECLFGEIVNGKMVLNRFGRVVDKCWRAIPRHFDHVESDEWVVMPNHLHGIICIIDDNNPGKALSAAHSPTPGATTGQPTPRRTGEAFSADPSATPEATTGQPVPRPGHATENASPRQAHLPSEPRGTIPGSLGAIVGNFKSGTSRRINRMRHTPGATIWQRNYYEHIIRDDADLEHIRDYIADNPARREGTTSSRRPSRKAHPAPVGGRPRRDYRPDYSNRRRIASAS